MKKEDNGKQQIPQNLELSPINSFCQTLFGDKVLDFAVDLSEIGIDCLLQIIGRGAIPDSLPIVKTFYALGITIPGLISLRKMLTLLQGIQRGKPDAAQIAKRNQAAKEGAAWLTKEVEMVVNYVERTAEIEKVKIQAEIYLDYLNLNISTAQFQEYFAIVDQLFLSDIPQIVEYYQADVERSEQLPVGPAGGKAILTTIDSVKSRRLESIGILYSAPIVKNGLYNGQKQVLTMAGKYLAAIFDKLNYPSLQQQINEAHRYNP